MAFYRKQFNKGTQENKATGLWTLDTQGSTAQVTYTANKTGLFITTVDDKGEKSFHKWISREHFAAIVAVAADVLKAFDAADVKRAETPEKETKTATPSATATIAASMQQMMMMQQQSQAAMMQMMQQQQEAFAAMLAKAGKK